MRTRTGPELESGLCDFRDTLEMVYCSGLDSSEDTTAAARAPGPPVRTCRFTFLGWRQRVKTQRCDT